MGLGLGIGMIVPTCVAYAQEQRFQNEQPVMNLVGTIALAATAISSVALIWRWLSNSSTVNDAASVSAEDQGRRPFQFGIRHLLIGMAATALVAWLISIVPLPEFATSWDGTSWVTFAAMMGMISWGIFQTAPTRRRVCVLLAWCFLPFAWVIGFNEPFGAASGLLSVLWLGPGILVAERLGSSVDRTPWIATIFVLVELAIGVLLAYRGGRLFASYAGLVLFWSTGASLVLHVLFLM